MWMSMASSEYDEFVPVATKIFNALPQSSVLSSSVFGTLCNVQGVCRELLTTTDANRDRVIKYDELVVPVATEILIATQLKRAYQRVCRHELGRVKPALYCLIRLPSVPWCCVSVVYSPCPAGCMAASHDASARCVPLPPPHHKGAWGHVKRANYHRHVPC